VTIPAVVKAVKEHKDKKKGTDNGGEEESSGETQKEE